MASEPSFMEYVRDQVGDPRLAYRRMFGEYAVYYDQHVVGFVCDNQLFIKPTEAGRALLRDVVEAPAYPGSKMYWLVTDELEDTETLRLLIQTTAQHVPPPKPKRKRR